jgi:hypothetical protein
MGTNKQLTEYFTEARFSPLQHYLVGITVEDLMNFQDEDFLEAVDKKHRLLMKAFLRSTREKIDEEIAAQGVLLDGDVLDAHSKVHSSAFGTSWVPVDRVPVQQLLHSFDRSLLDRVKVLDLSGNDLIAEDLIHINNIVQALPNLEQIDISFNRMAKSDSDNYDLLKQWLDKKGVHVVGNYFVDTPNFALSLSSAQLKNLLWIPPNWLEGRGWSALFANHPDQEKIVYDSHKTWYADHTRRGAGTGYTKDRI